MHTNCPLYIQFYPTLKCNLSCSFPKQFHGYIIKHKPVVKSVCLKGRAIPESAKKYLEMSDMEYYLLFMDTLCKNDLKMSLPFYEFYRMINSFKNTHKNIDGVFCSGFIPDTEHYPVLKYVRCPAGTTKISVLPDGSVYP